MKKTIVAVMIALFAAGCGTTTAVEQTKAPEPGALKSLEIQQESNTRRIEVLEKELSETKASLDRIQRQSKQLGESYDGLLSLFNDQKKIMKGLMDNLNKLFGPTEKQDAKPEGK